MSNLPKAHFAKYPRTIEEVRQPYDIRTEQPYEIVKVISLAPIDYENFVTDLCADRWFLEENAHLCAEGEPLRCLFIHCEGRSDGLLALPNLPNDPSHLKFAAVCATDSTF